MNSSVGKYRYLLPKYGFKQRYTYIIKFSLNYKKLHSFLKICLFPTIILYLLIFFYSLVSFYYKYNHVIMSRMFAYNFMGNIWFGKKLSKGSLLSYTSKKLKILVTTICIRLGTNMYLFSKHDCNNIVSNQHAISIKLC